MAIRGAGFEGSLRIYGAEPSPPYDRTALSKSFLSETLSISDIKTEWDEDVDAEYLADTAVVRVDLRDKRMELSTHGYVRYDGLVGATGSVPRRLRGLNYDDTRVFELHSIVDALALREAARGGPHVGIIGGGLIGVEAGSVLSDLGCRITMISFRGPLSHLGTQVSAACAAAIRASAVSYVSGVRLESVMQGRESIHLSLDGGRMIDVDLLLVAIGGVPATGWLRDSGVGAANGLDCDDQGRVLGSDGFVAAGDVARFADPWAVPSAEPRSFGHWDLALEQGRVAGRSLIGATTPGMGTIVPKFTSDHFGMHLQAVGALDAPGTTRTIESRISDREFVVTIRRGNRLVGAVGYNSPVPMIQHYVSVKTALSELDRIRGTQV